MPAFEDLTAGWLKQLCTCGCPASQHHITWYPRGLTIDECLSFGCNEMGGMMLVDAEGQLVNDYDDAYDEDGHIREGHGWVIHCTAFKAKEN